MSSKTKFNLDLIKEIPIEEVIETLGGRKYKSSGSIMHCCNVSAHKNGDKHPSMGINRSKNTCKCFACGMGGDSIEIVKNMLGVNFKEACKWLYANFPTYLGEFLGELEEDISFYANKKPMTPRKVESVYSKAHFDNQIKDSIKEIVLNNYISEYESFEDYQKIKFIYTFIYRYSLLSPNRDKVISYYKNRGIEKMGTFGLLERETIISLEEILIKKFPIEDLKRFKVFNDEGHFKYKNMFGFSVVPMFDLNTNLVTGLTLRAINPKQTKFKEMQLIAQDFLVAYPYNTNRALRDKKRNYIFLTEGHIDGLSLGVDNFISLTGVYNYNHNVLSLIKKSGKKVVIAFDNDEAGQNGAKRLKEALNGLEIPNQILQWNLDWGNDLNELLKNNKLKEVLKNNKLD